MVDIVNLRQLVWPWSSYGNNFAVWSLRILRISPVCLLVVFWIVLDLTSQRPARPRLLFHGHGAIEAQLQQCIENRGFNLIKKFLRQNTSKNEQKFFREKKFLGLGALSDLVVLQLWYTIVGTRFQKDFLKYMVGGNLILPRICMSKKALKCN